MKLHNKYSLRYQSFFEHRIALPQEGVPAVMLDYIEKNVKNNWGWGHENGVGIISFSNSKDAVLIGLMIDKWI